MNPEYTNRLELGRQLGRESTSLGCSSQREHRFKPPKLSNPPHRVGHPLKLQKFNVSKGRVLHNLEPCNRPKFGGFFIPKKREA